MGLTEFLLARIEEDRWRFCTGGRYLDTLVGPELRARMLAEVKAKRRIVARHTRTDRSHWSGQGNCLGCGFYGDSDLPVTNDREVCPELADLAAVYADHPDYDESWRP